ncbi:GntR family transcriptional regulator [Rhodococcus gordoniae]|uniref:GntR family transcriptional regulator n=1 Tax=Rhodococcus gordoniae TaxID=223392 RepID=A0A379M5X1_9NOCA|nr:MULTISPECIES: GntR family transcriptional regulator [Rhodococcus]UTT49524.1 GntR family transcriptional regulator [Rhodococcus gordoniae]SUE16938.1 GntR family transcriptional regulator [Rhodococcus gordoniae]
MLDLTIDPDSTVPPFEQLRRRIVDLVHEGELIAGSKLPTVRGLADTLGIAPNTVAKTYRELEKLGVLEARGRAGTFVADTGDPTRTRAQRSTHEYVAEVRALGMSDDEILDFVSAALRAG